MPELQSGARRIRCTGGSQQASCDVAGALLFGRCLYGAECHYITDNQFAHMRRVICIANGDAEGRRSDGVRLLVIGAGKWDPEVVRMKRLVRHWQKEALHYDIVTEHWELIRDASGRHGPMSLMRHTSDKADVGRASWQSWSVGGRGLQILEE